MTDSLAVRPTSEQDLERFLIGELPPSAMGRLRSAEERDPDLRDRLDRLRRSSHEILAAHPPAAMAAAIRQRLKAPSPSKCALKRWRCVVLAGATAATVLAAGLSVRRPGAAPTEDRLKGGGAAVIASRWTPGGPQWLAAGSTAVAGDVLRIGYRAGGRRFGAILSVDASGTVTQHFPPAGDRSGELAQAGTTWLDPTFELKRAHLWERFYLVTGDRVFELGPLREAARTSATRGSAGAPPALKTADGLGQAAFSITRRDAP